jgi:hypothetical protein
VSCKQCSEGFLIPLCSIRNDITDLDCQNPLGSYLELAQSLAVGYRPARAFVLNMRLPLLLEEAAQPSRGGNKHHRSGQGAESKDRAAGWEL